MDDFELLQNYALRNTEDAFRALTVRYLNLVYSAAVRQTGSAETAKDVTQAVFLVLAKKAGTLSRNTVLAGWLLRATHYAAANARRLEQRRQYYEQQAMESYVHSTGVDHDWPRIAPLLDEALDGLAEKDREAVVLRFFEQMPLKQVAQRLGVSEDGAQKRVGRALDKLRAFFARHGRTVSLGALANILAAKSVEAVPSALAASVCADVAVSGAFAVSVAHATLGTIDQLRLRLFTIGVAVVLAGLAAIVMFQATKNVTHSLPVAATFGAMLLPSEALAIQANTSATVIPGALTPPPDTPELLLHVIDAQTTGPVVNARLTLVSVTALSLRATNTFKADANGVAHVTYPSLPVKSWSHSIEVFRDGYVPRYVSWSEFQQDRIDEIPANYTVRLDPAVTIGGLVVDEQGVAVPGARVVFSVSGSIPHRSRERLTMMGDYHTEVTGAEGRWTCNHVPDRFGMIDFKVVHPQFQEAMWMTDSSDSSSVNVEKIPEADLRSGRALMRLKSGLVIAGVVTDESGQPVAGALITQDFDFHRPERSVPTDSDGFFQFRNGRPDKLFLTVETAGLAPVVTSIVLRASIENLRVTLPAGRLLLGRVVDESDDPVGHATVEAASPSNDSRKLFRWRGTTDPDGRFAWDSAPAIQVYAIFADGYETQHRCHLNADSTEQTVRLTRIANSVAPNIYGQVLDAETKQPPAAVRIQIWETRKEIGGGFYSSSGVAEDAEKDGTFRRKISPETLSYVIEAQADGYWPRRLTNEAKGEREMNLQIELRKAPLAAGLVLTPSGEPAAGATLVVCGHNQFAQMNYSGKLLTDGRLNGTVSTVADAQGRFRLPNKYAPEMVVIGHAEGFVEIPFSDVTSNSVITLQPWGGITGTVRVGSRPLGGESIRLNRPSWRMYCSPRVSVVVQATTDADGRFVFATVPPGEWEVYRELKSLPEADIRAPASTHGVPVVVSDGQTATVSLDLLQLSAPAP